jgi:hypothetical protein
VEKYRILWDSYQEVNQLERYEDEKAARAFQAEAFLTIAVATVFAGSFVVMNNTFVPPMHSALIFVIWLEYISLFFVYLVSMLAGTYFIIGAMFPFHKSKGRPRIESHGDGPGSIYFYQTILGFASDEEVWAKYISQLSADDLLQKGIRDLTRDIRIISERTRGKVATGTKGFEIYRFSILVMIFWTVSLVAYVLSVFL